MNDYKKKLKKIKSLLDQHNAKIIAHYYVDESLQRVAEDTGGIVDPRSGHAGQQCGCHLDEIAVTARIALMIHLLDGFG